MTETNVSNMNVFSRIINTFVAPTKTFEAVAEKPSWVLPMIIILVLSVGLMLWIQPVIKVENMNKAVEKWEQQGLSADQIEMAKQQSEKWMGIMMLPMGVIGTFLVLLISALVWWFVTNTILGGQANFGHLMAVVTLKQFINTLGGIVKAPLIVAQNTLQVLFGPATFLSESSQDTFLYKFLANFDIFNLWGIAILCIGIAVVGKRDIKKVWPWVVIVYLLWYAGSAALGNIFG